MVAIRTDEVWKSYGVNTLRQVDAVRNVSVIVEEGAVTAFGGPSGSGKTTLLSLIGLLTRPSKGKVFLGDHEVSQFSEVYRTKMRREEIGFVFQAQYLLPQLTAVENVALPKICTNVSRDDAEDLARIRLIDVGLEQRLDFKVAELSGGELQRVSIARSLMNSPRILIADEPSSSIDEALTKEVLATLKKMVEDDRLTVVVASHDPIVLNWAEVRYMMRDGEIINEK